MGSYKNILDEVKLLDPPIMRAAYSDRTAWLMSAMSELAYYPFEDTDKFLKLATELAKLNNVEEIEKRLKTILSSTVGGGNQKKLEEILKIAGFELLRTYNRNETQAFLAKKMGADGLGMLILAFRGTEKNVKDFFTNANSTMVTLYGKERVHKGFYEAFNHVSEAITEDLSQHQGIPIYITGHSLGGALAVLATRMLASDSQGACYTFGSPRVGNSELDNRIKTPIYRIVNTADMVPRVPPAYFIYPFLMLANLFHITPISNFLRRFKGYVHYGDMRYLNHVTPGFDESFKGVALHSNPSLPFQFAWRIRRRIATFGRASASDHSIALYRKKLMAYALSRADMNKVA